MVIFLINFRFALVNVCFWSNFFQFALNLKKSSKININFFQCYCANLISFPEQFSFNLRKIYQKNLFKNTLLINTEFKTKLLFHIFKRTRPFTVSTATWYYQPKFYSYKTPTFNDSICILKLIFVNATRQLAGGWCNTLYTLG